MTKKQTYKKITHAGFWSFDELFIVKKLSTIIHALTQIIGTGAFFYHIYDTQIYILILATPVVWIAIRFIFEILVVPFTISYDLDRIARKLEEK